MRSFTVSWQSEYNFRIGFIAFITISEIDYLFIDLPPGTGDVPLTLSQSVALSGVVVGTTPQGVALEDVERGMAMFDKVEVDVLGVVENMSYYLCAQCNERHEIFAHGGGAAAAAKLGVPFLGVVPLAPEIRRAGDAGDVVGVRDGEYGSVFAEIGQRLVAELGKL
mgnify:CR=1 FL=1